MIRYHQFRPCRGLSNAFIATGFALLAATQTSGAVDIEPAIIEFNNVQDVVTISVTQNGKPVPAASIQSVKLLVGSHDYDHMIRVEKGDGRITVHPTEALQLGTYDLAIATSHGNASADVLALLKIVDESLAARAARQRISVEDLKAQLGVSQTLRRDSIELNLSALYYVGQILQTKIVAPEDRAGVWLVNGETIAPKDGLFRYVFEQEGIYDFAYLEKIGENVVATGLASVQVVHEPAMAVEVKEKIALTLAAPEGFNRYEWMLDGMVSGTEATWKITFESAGQHQVTVRASEPAPTTGQAFRLITYAITVR